MPDTHDERIRAAFTPQAATFEDARLNVAFTSSVPWLIDHMAPRVDDIVLDVAGGTGLVSRALAHRVAHAVVVDTTPVYGCQELRSAIPYVEERSALWRRHDDGSGRVRQLRHRSPKTLGAQGKIGALAQRPHRRTGNP